MLYRIRSLDTPISSPSSTRLRFDLLISVPIATDSSRNAPILSFISDTVSSDCDSNCAISWALDEYPPRCLLPPDGPYGLDRATADGAAVCPASMLVIVIGIGVGVAIGDGDGDRSSAEKSA